MSIIQHPYWSINIKKSAECELDRAYYTRHGSQYIAYDVCCKKCGCEIDKTKKQIYQEELYHLLMEKEKFLRILQNKHGKGVSYMDEEEDDFD